MKNPIQPDRTLDITNIYSLILGEMSLKIGKIWRATQIQARARKKSLFLAKKQKIQANVKENRS
jgi:hypothetical protein